MKYNTEYFINKFERIPDNKWTTGTLVRGHKKCVFGHCGGYETEEANAIANIIIDNLTCTPMCINDGWYDNQIVMRSLGNTPKERILNALCVIYAMELGYC